MVPAADHRYSISTTVVLDAETLILAGLGLTAGLTVEKYRMCLPAVIPVTVSPGGFCT